MELNKITNLINYIDSEMTKIKDKILEIDKVVFQVDSKTKNSGLLGLESKKVSLLREYDLLLTRYGKLVEQRRDVLDTLVRGLCKNDIALHTDDNRTIYF
ncbi:hypothetical protein CIRMBP1271_00414 [Enterococcus cecorum]|uniref:hypothetical protein n=1 Tax=Enterococcus cecorum TaxID=44008 RepID=UPI0006578672|nr:hypothetical protein [Enterococcus cecorum]KLO67528.1 hypothetical protein AA985_01110 [Enterococcus cecorum]CAI3255677.1 hypothetical protein CIRMBP1243_00084 [Enterococcus cecorum]CAI3256339.1 hypothetical protein CIRMBP1217_00071 [Enterococcus cecorum]CAI3256686.1 hypothetical protein CIRMBP1226_00099 [Enterococcus cecorum]CAI3257063.1 hypothetical protein CIRMBP1195_00071 [Enterococcus cecorum]